MRIALFTDAYYPRINGVATSVMMLKKYFEGMGHEVLVVTTADPEAPFIENNIIRIPSIPFKTQRLGLIAGFRIRKIIKTFKPDIIHTHSEYTLGFLGHAMAKRLKVPYVHTMHTVWEYYTEYVVNIDLLEPAARAAMRTYTAIICNKADKVITPTSKVDDLLISYGVTKDITVIPTGIELDKFDAKYCTQKQLDDIRAELGIKSNEKVLLYIGRIEKEKNIDELLVSLQNYLQSHSDIKLVLVGDGTARKELQKLAEELGIDKKVVFAGLRPWDKINLYYRIGDVFVGASISETQGLTYTEAMASGLPVIAREDRCLEGILTHGENGFLFSDTDSLISAIETLMTDTQMRHRFSEKAVAASQNFSSKVYAEKVLEVYKELLKV